MSLALFTTHTHLSSLLPPPQQFLQKQTPPPPPPQSASKKGIPHTSTAGRILQSGTGSAGSGGWRTSRGRRGGAGRRTFLLAWRGVGCWCLVGTGGSGVSFRYGWGRARGGGLWGSTTMLLADAVGVSDGFCGRHGDGDGVFNGWVISNWLSCTCGKLG